MPQPSAKPLEPGAAPHPGDRAKTTWRTALPALLLAAVGFGVTVLLLFPGYLTNDAGFIHGYVENWHLGDWQSPLLTIVWWLVDPIAPGAGSMFLLGAAIYWLGFGLVAAAVARRSSRLALTVPLLALAPPALMLLSMIWRDILLAGSWLVAAALAYVVADRRGAPRGAAQVVALALVAFGILLRPNTIVSAPLLIGYVAWPARFEWKRMALMFVPAVLAGYALVHVVYYEILDVKRENPLHSLLVFDLGGITHFAHENQFPVAWSPQQTALLTDDCYKPTLWDIYWTLEPCRFVMARLEQKDDVIFGTQRLVNAWLAAVVKHPLAYLEHRLDVLWTFLAKPNLTLELFKLDVPGATPMAQNHSFMALLRIHDALKSTFIYRTGFWLILAGAIGAFAWPARATASGAFAVGVTACAVFYVLSYGVFAVAVDFRYGYWCVLASLAAVVPALIARRDKPALTAASPA